MSVVVTTEKAKVIVVNKKDKNFLGEDLKSVIDRILLAPNFFDYDRPLKNLKDLQAMVDKQHTWTSWKGGY